MKCQKEEEKTEIVRCELSLKMRIKINLANHRKTNDEEDAKYVLRR